MERGRERSLVFEGLSQAAAVVDLWADPPGVISTRKAESIVWEGKATSDSWEYDRNE